MKPHEIQAEYYKNTAAEYDTAHILGEEDEHNLALRFLSSAIRQYSIRSILDVGAGTGRVLSFLLKEHPDVRVVAVEPVKELREQGYKKGIPPDLLRDGNGNQLDFASGEFDIVCAFGVLHHVPDPARVVDEMLRVGKRGIFISDSNNFGQGSFVARTIKQTINFFGLWKLYDRVATRGKGFHISEGDGLFYSYSIFNNYRQIRSQCPRIYLINTHDGGHNFYRTASHVALLGMK
jgi:ubiquinone/menaquinone biosynthesis C-methylase UbiE